MNYKKILMLLTSAVALAALTLSSLACSNEMSKPQPVDVYDTSGGVAAVVNDVEIGENAINNYIANLRRTKELTEDKDWATFLSQNGVTSIDDFRKTLIQNASYRIF